MGSPITRWTPARIQELRAHVSQNQLFMKEIAEKMGLKTIAVRHKCRQLGIRTKPPGRMAEWNRKHAHLREDVLKYFLTHSFEETAKHFGLTLNEMKSCMSNGYMDPNLKHLRKEWRPHSAWTTKDWVFMVQNVGIQPREWIGKKLKRGNTYNSVKDALAKFRGLGKYMNGMPWGWTQELFGLDAHRFSILTKAGPSGDRGQFYYRILPWVTAARLIETGKTRPILGKGKVTRERRASAPRVEVHPEVASGIRAMAEFQRWIYGTQSEREIVRRIRATLRKR
jgi:hypothetical protein